MSSCKDCVHYERCKWNADTLRDAGLLVDFTDDDESASERCIFFKNKANFVEVVRCKDCKYFEIDEEDELGECKCGCISVSYGGVLYPHRTDFCSYGESRCEDGKV